MTSTTKETDDPKEKPPVKNGVYTVYLSEETYREFVDVKVKENWYEPIKD